MALQQSVVSKDPIARVVESVAWMQPSTEIAAQKAITKPFENAGKPGEALLSFLHGHWLHEPLHVVLTDVPVGAWSVTFVADTIDGLSGGNSLNKVADVALLIGLIGAAGAAVTGLVEWSAIKGEAPRRIGATHGVLNIAGTALFAASYFARGKSRRRSLARYLAAAGYAVTSLSAHLGGILIYEHGVGVQKDALARVQGAQ